MISFASMHPTFFGVKKSSPSVSVAGGNHMELGVDGVGFPIELDDPTFDLWLELRLQINFAVF